MIKLKIGKTYTHLQTQEQVVISDIKTGSLNGNPTTVYMGDESLSAHEFKKAYRHYNGK
ncbi:MAG: hypothetical protein COA63_010815 [Methylophaga sp.]|nr:hypothetical protein [Methylophaga sp.]